MRSSQPGTFQLASPNSIITEQYRARQDDSEQLYHALAAKHERAEHQHHDRGGGGDRSAGGGQAVRDGRAIVATAVPFLEDPADQEHLVVHGEAEQDREHEHGHERLDRTGLVDPDQRRAPAVLEDGCHYSERRAGGEQIHHRCRERNQEAAEDGHQQQEAEQHYDTDEQRELARQHVAEVVEDGGLAAREHVDAGATLGRRDHLTSHRVQQVGGRDILGRALGVDVGDSHVGMSAHARREPRARGAQYAGRLCHGLLNAHERGPLCGT